MSLLQYVSMRENYGYVLSTSSNAFVKNFRSWQLHLKCWVAKFQCSVCITPGGTSALRGCSHYLRLVSAVKFKTQDSFHS